LSDKEASYLAQPDAERRPTIPAANDGKVNVQEIARQLGCARAYLYDFEPLSTLIDLFAEGQGLLAMGARSQSDADKLIK
jgi:hypothetical protein